MEGNLLIDSGTRHPFLNRPIGAGGGVDILKHQIRRVAPFAHQRGGLPGDVEILLAFGLFLPEYDSRVLAFRLGDFPHFVNGQVHPRSFLRLEVLDPTAGVHGDNPIVKGMIQASPQLVEVRQLGIARQRLFLVALPFVVFPCPCIVIKIFPEAIDPIRGDFGKGDSIVFLIPFQVVEARKPIPSIAPAFSPEPLLAHRPIIVEE